MERRKSGSGRPYPKTLRVIMACPSRRHFVTRQVMSIRKSLFDIVQPSTLRKPESDTDRGDDTQVKIHKFCPKWLEEFHWLNYDSSEKEMKCKVCPYAYGCKPKPSQNFVHGANNLVLIFATLLNMITFKF